MSTQTGVVLPDVIVIENLLQTLLDAGLVEEALVDGDLLEQVLDLDRGEQMRILQSLGGEDKVSRALRLVEDLSRLH